MIAPHEVRFLAGRPIAPKGSAPRWKGHRADGVNYRARKAWEAFKPRYEAWKALYARD